MKQKETLYLQSTEVSALKSIGEITAVLVKAGARSIHTQYGENRQAAGLEWSMYLYDRPVLFRMPVKVEPVYKVLHKRASGFVDRQRAERLRDQAERIAWRQMLAWVRLQMALIELGMVEYAEVFLPFCVGGSGQTMWDAMRATEFKQLEAGAAE